MLKAGLVGAGHLGKIHLKLLNQSEKYDLVGFHDKDIENSKKLEAEFGYKFYENLDELLDKIEVLDIVTPTFYHHDYAKIAIERGLDFFIEKPVTQTLEQAEEIIQLCNEKGIRAQVGHVERYNPAFIATKPFISEPKFIEIHRLAEFNPRGTDVSVVLDLMIHDLDILLYGNEIIQNERLTIPHYDMHNREFVIVPLFEIESDLVLPNTQPLADLVKQFDDHEMIKLNP